MKSQSKGRGPARAILSEPSKTARGPGPTSAQGQKPQSSAPNTAKALLLLSLSAASANVPASVVVDALAGSWADNELGRTLQRMVMRTRGIGT